MRVQEIDLNPHFFRRIYTKQRTFKLTVVCEQIFCGNCSGKGKLYKRVIIGTKTKNKYSQPVTNCNQLKLGAKQNVKVKINDCRKANFTI